MEKIDLNQTDLANWPVDEWGRVDGPLKGGMVKDIADKLNEIIPILDKLAIRVARLEVYYKAHRKEHNK